MSLPSSKLSSSLTVDRNERRVALVTTEMRNAPPHAETVYMSTTEAKRRARLNVSGALFADSTEKAVISVDAPRLSEAA